MSELVPEGWERRKLGKLGRFSTSSVDKKISSQESVVQLLNYMDVYQNSRLDESFPFQHVTAPAKQIDSSSVLNGDVFFTPSSETPDDIGHSAVFIGGLQNVVHSYHTVRFRLNSVETFDNEFKAYAFKAETTYEYFRQRATGSTRFTVSLPVFENLEVLIPPLPEQKKIASILSSVDEVIENTRAQINKLQDLKKALMQNLLTKGIGHTKFKNSELGQIPKNWSRLKLKDVSIQTKGLTYTSADYAEAQHGFPFLTLKSISKSGGYSPVGLKFYKGSFKEQHILNVGDILFANTDLTRDGDVVGNPLYFDGLGFKNKTLYSMDLSKLVVDTGKVDGRFVYYLLMSHRVKRFMVNASAGSTVLHLDTERARNLPINIPPLPEQKKIASILTSVDKLIENTQTQINKSKSLKKALMQDLLTGKVRVSA